MSARRKEAADRRARRERDNGGGNNEEDVRGEEKEKGTGSEGEGGEDVRKTKPVRKLGPAFCSAAYDVILQQSGSDKESSTVHYLYKKK